MSKRTQEQITRIKYMHALRKQGFSDSDIGRLQTPPLTRARVHALLGAKDPAMDGRKTPRIAVPGDNVKGFNDDDKALRLALLAWRGRHGFTQKQAAAICGLATSAAYSKWENGKGCALPLLVIRFIELWEYCHKNQGPGADYA